MTTTTRYIAAAFACFCFIGLGSQVSARPEASRSAQPSSQHNNLRDAAIQRCVLQDQKRYPRSGNGDFDTPRTAAYKLCMTDAGFPPQKPTAQKSVAFVFQPDGSHAPKCPVVFSP
jgi:hypothetical protein